MAYVQNRLPWHEQFQFQNDRRDSDVGTDRFTKLYAGGVLASKILLKKVNSVICCCFTLGGVRIEI
ncbi:MAG: hypothetical protein DBP02_20255 [gamma proteobacterium symbiont of Ctena orbiculata]|nr:MAG: hypothetical protein DBP02_20255 [gamma proteobacterium symbiont of Ctena orbiculata]